MRLRKRSSAEPAGAQPHADGDAARAAYDAVAYPSYAFPQTHPGRLAAQAKLFGLDPAPVATARFLELGCSDGGNLIPMALDLPDATFVGVDVSGVAIARGRAAADALGATNLTLLEADVAALDHKALGRFDYIVAHGVYSWVPPAVRDGLLETFRACLRGDGVAYVSYNAKPGAYLRAPVRDVMRRATRGIDDPDERVRVARAALDLTARSLSAGQHQRGLIREYADRLRDRSDFGVFHDELADVNEAFYLEEVVEHAQRHRLEYLSEADLHETAHGNHPDEVMDALDELAGDDELDREQQLDHLVLRGFRQTLLRRRETRRSDRPRPETLDDLYASAEISPAKRGATLTDRSHVQFRGGKGATLTTDHPDAKQALAKLGDAWPAPISVRDLHGDSAPAVRQALLAAHSANLVQLSTHAPPIANEPGARPRAREIARRQAESGGLVVNGWHERVALGDELAAYLLTLLDGTRDRSQLAAAMREGGAGKNAQKRLDASLDQLASLALLVNDL